VWAHVAAGETLGDVGEFAFLDRVLPGLPQGLQVLVGPGDDAAVLDLLGTQVVVCTDVLVEGSHFRRDWSSAHDVGRKAVAVNVADVAAMGARPVAVLAGVAAPGDLAVDWLVDLARGLRDEAGAAGCSLVGGDTVAGPAVSVTVSALGVLDGPAVTRAGAQPGDVVALCGRLGYAAAGLAVLQRGFRSPRALVDAHRCPTPPYAAGPQAAAAGATAMIDVSDGLLADLGHVAAASSVAIRLVESAVTVEAPIEAMARGLGADPRAWVFGGGEDHALAACFRPGTDLPTGWTDIGEVAEGSGVSVDGWDELPVGLASSGGYQHFA
jgi:thiamine-monophosphate kinase